MDCSRARSLIEIETEGSLEARDALELSRHVAVCADCAALRAALLAIDRALAEGWLDRAPEGFAAAVAAGIRRRAEGRWLSEPAVVTIASAIGAAGAGYGIARALSARGAGPLSRWAQGLADWLGTSVGPLAARVPGLDAGLWDDPAAAGVLTALAAAALVFLVVVIARFPKQLSVEWR